jgi:hypothetical protein
LGISILLKQLDLKYETQPQMMPDYSIQDQKNQGRTRKPKKGVAKGRSPHVEVLLKVAPPESDTPTGSLAQ